LTSGKNRVLVADDDPAVLRICREALEIMGCEVHEAPDGARALALLESVPFSLLLTDVVLPDADGLDLLADTVARHPDTLVVVMTGFASIEVAKRAIQMGAFDLVTKPFRVEELLATVVRAFEVRGRLTTELRSELSELHQLASVTDVSSDGLSRYVKRLSSALARSFRADASAVFVIPFGDRPTSVSGDDLYDDKTWAAFARLIQKSPDGLVLERGSDARLSTEKGPSSIMGIPLNQNDSEMAICVVARASNVDPFTPRDLKLLSLFAAHAANQILYYGLTEDLRRTAGELEQINLVTTTFSSSLDTNRVVEIVGQGMREFLPFEVLASFLAGQGLPALGFVLARDGLPVDEIRDKLMHLVSPVLGAEAYEQAWKDGFFEHFPAEEEDRDGSDQRRAGTGASAFASLEWRSFVLGEQGRLRGVMVAGVPPDRSSWKRRQRYLPILAGSAVAALGNAHLHKTGERNYIQTIAALASAVDAKDPYTHNHSRNVTAYSLAIADYLGMPDDQREALRNAALLHDIGKIGIPEAILNKPGSLTNEEYMVIKAHPEIGYRILSPMTALADIRQAVRHHHNRYDGKGYPDNLAGEDIPYHSRILAVADVFDAMTADRVYRPAPGIEYAVSELRANAGTQLDPSVAFALIDVLSQRGIEQILEEYSVEVSK
jgi:putative nucleotidyltransferase with HDIG domain